MKKDLENQIKALLLSLYVPKDFVDWANKYEDEITQLEKRLNTVDNKIEEANDQTNKTFHFANRVRYWLQNGTHEERRTIVSTLGSNLTLNQKILRLDLLKPLEYTRRISGELLLSDYQFVPIKENDTTLSCASSFLQFPLWC